MATQRRHRGSARLAIAGLIVGALAWMGVTPAIAAEGSEVFVYTGNDADPLGVGYLQLGGAVGLPVVESSTFPTYLSSYECILLPVNRTSFSPGITSALVAYVNGGGNLLAIGENDLNYASAIETMNEVSAAVGASMSLTYENIDPGVFATHEIDASPLTEGVSSIGYAGTAGVALDVDGTAQSLVRTRLGGTAPRTTFVAAETIGGGTFVLMGDHMLADNLLDLFGNDNLVLGRNLCTGSLVQRSFDGFMGPVDEDVVNTVKAGATVPLQFRIFDGDTEITDPAVVESFTVTPVTCPDAAAPVDEVEFTTTGKTELRYTNGKFQQNWKTPKTKGCYQVTVATTDGATLTSDFVLR
ncbi:hypothetical protein GA707_16840 [Nostocoides sp. F2B08]|uniref:PxKF domain-containing protein n=1 Tax=Nostocoides sp. F2B08 TaxID=2653936 RepID=UPI001262DEC0|nr:PxKF domain-containing protein [Tetrasphaera sp. F2B08]KAB7741880.1 hypothetical protein GA707_16840 [Tetrasphaera sp. F2B08]